MTPPAETLRIRDIVFPTDGSASAEYAFAQAVFYAANHGATLHVLSVAYGRENGEPVVIPAPGAASAAFLDRLREAAVASVGLDLVQAEVEARSPEDGILAYAERVEADLIVMATHGRRGFDHLLIGSVAEAVVRRSGCPVLTVRPTAKHTEVRAKRILVPVDFSDASYLALAHAVVLARLHGAGLDLVHIVEPPNPGIAGAGIGWGEDLTQRLDDARTALHDLTTEVDGGDASIAIHAFLGPPGLGVIESAEHLDADFIVMGTHGRTGVQRFFLGSVAEKVVQLAPCPVFVVKPFGKDLLPAPVEAASSTHA